MLDTQIGFIGAGQMGRALARGFVQANLVSPERVLVSDPVPEARHAFQETIRGARPVETGRLVEESTVVFLAVKPQNLAAVFQELKTVGKEETLFVSVAAGVTLSTLVQGLGTQRVVRVMPNTACLVGLGASGYCLALGATPEDDRLIGQLLQSVGVAVRLDEGLLDAVTGLSGSGPAFVYQFLEALSDGGVRVGLPRDAARQLAAQTVYGAAAMVLQTGEHPAVLKDRVASPGGTTIVGLQALEDGGMRAAVMKAVEAATERSRQLGAK
jgi:pyrroline-5-carboxylate reductase